MDLAPAIVAAAFVVFAVVSRRLSRSAVTGTMVFAALGVALGPEVFDLVDYDRLVERFDLFGLILTGTLVIVLFTDASAINSSNWRDDILPARLLGIGLPVAIGLGWLLAAVLLGTLEIWEAAVLGTMLAPTDAALGKAVVSNERVPRRIRQALNIESGLNDGIALPLFLVFLETALVAEESLAVSEIFLTLLEQVGVALVVGIAVGWIGAYAIAWGRSSGAALGYWLEIALVSLAVSAYAIATPLGGSGFIAAWVAGFAFGKWFVSAPDDPLPEFAEAFGDLLTMASFFVFGIFLGPVLVDLTWQVALYGVLSLAAVRVIAVFVALAGAKMRWQSVLYIGWFGPRGLATIILTIEVIDESTLNGSSTIADAALFTVGLSVLLHGLTAWWGSNAYADFVQSHPRQTELAEDVEPRSIVRVPFRARQQPVGRRPGPPGGG
jgi:NhaP-type Na+/H+ or K+/H+ antiporter